ncbi:flagellar biosynthetic protein FliR [Candidatus Haliotispira prima]|uniref:Flagellar biosynthetic protein FliR n=1 Tax=Candidatus Haliotispira prima TaxID=3034016 RepID=A0ABY8MJG0_9SPIO|nr:flagellar biosynthetic protein FliR [Candidatus Haliotispira prima]
MYFETQLQIYFLIFARITAMLLTMPFLSARSIPPPARGGLIFFLSMAVMPLVQDYPVSPSLNGGDFIFSILAEIMVGILIGLLVLAIFAIFHTAGEIFSMQMAFSAAQIFDPMGESEQPLLSQYMETIALLLFLSVGPLHNFMLRVLAQGFTVLPTARVLLLAHENLLDVTIYTMSFLLQQALFIALPIVATIMVVSITLGLMAKAAPQMNLLVLGFPIQTSMGFIVLLLVMPFLLEQIARLLDYGLHDILHVLGTGSYSESGLGTTDGTRVGP